MSDASTTYSNAIFAVARIDFDHAFWSVPDDTGMRVHNLDRGAFHLGRGSATGARQRIVRRISVEARLQISQR
jgi:hypothetical protein